MVLTSVKQLEAPIGKIYMKSRGGEPFSRKSLYEGKHARLPRSHSVPPIRLPSRDPHVEEVFPRLSGVYGEKKSEKKSINDGDGTKQNEWDWVKSYADKSRSLVPGNNKTSYKIQWGYQGPDYDEKCRVRDKMQKMLDAEGKPQWYPKDILQVSLPRTRKNGSDPIYLDHPMPHAIVNNFGCGEAPPLEVPTRYARWSNEEAWNDPRTHACFKITGKVL